MESVNNPSLTLPFSEFPEDVQVCVLSFLRPSDLAAFSLSCKRFLSLFHDQRVWFSLCHRRWGSRTLIPKWGRSIISYKRLYAVLSDYDRLIGFWRRCGGAAPSLVFFEWRPSCVSGSTISPSGNGGYGVVKKPFLWMSVDSDGEPVSYVDFDGRLGAALKEEEEDVMMGVVSEENEELIRVNVGFIGDCHVVVEENNIGGFCSSGNYENVLSGSPPDDKVMTEEVYQYFANRTSPSGSNGGASRRQRRREKEKQGRRMRKLEPEHFVKIVNCSPEPSRPLQGLWKGICDDMSLDFYLVSYDDIGGIACRKVGDANRPLTYHAPVFWTSNLIFMESPFSPEEDHIYNSRLHLRPPQEADQIHSLSSDIGAVSRMLYINSSYDLLIPDLVGDTVNHRQFEGRVWQYENGTFGFGFLRDNYIIDLKHIADDGHILDTIEPSNNS